MSTAMWLRISSRKCPIGPRDRCKLVSRPIEWLIGRAVFSVQRMNNLGSWVGLGIEPRDMTLLQISMRAVIVFIAALCLIRFAHKRFLAGKTGFDVLLAF